MKINKILLLLLFIVIHSSIYSQISIEYCQSEAKKNYPLVKKYDLIEKSVDYSLSNANSNYYPQVSFTGIAGMVDGMPEFSLPGQESSSNDYNLISIIQLNQNIWDGGITSAHKDKYIAESEIEKADLDITFNQLEDRINNIFFGILLIDERMRLLDILYDNLNRNLKNVETAVTNGTAYKSDMDEIKVEILNTEKSKAELSFSKNSYLNMLSAFIGKDIDENSSFIKPEPIHQYASLAIKRPELSLFQNQKTLVDAQYSMSTASLYPKIGLLGLGVFIEPGINFGTSDITNLMVGGLNLSWEIGGLYTSSNNRQLAKINTEKINSLEETFLFNTKLDLSQSDNEIKKLKLLIEKDNEIIELKSRVKKSYEIKFNNGVATMTELLNKTNEENLARQDKIMHEIQYMMASFKYKNMTGN